MNAWASDRRGPSAVLGLMLAAGLASPAWAWTEQAELVSDSALRVCADPANLPFSNQAGEGFENRIADLLGRALDRPVEYTWFPQATGFIRRTLAAGACDLVIGYAQGHELVQNTNHYYTSAYVLVTADDGPLAGVTRLDDPLLRDARLGVVAGTPPASHLARLGLMGQTEGYALYADRRHQDPIGGMFDDLAAGRIDAALVWGPIGGPRAKARGGLSVTPLIHESQSPRLVFRITMGVRRGDVAWKHRLNALIEAHQAEIDAILAEAGVPLLNDMGTAVKDLSPPEATTAPAATVPEPEGYRGPPYLAPVPATLAGAQVVTTPTAQILHSGGAVFIDVLPHARKPEGLPEDTLWLDTVHDSIPGAVWLPDTGYEALPPETEIFFRDRLTALADGTKPLVIFCKRDCWMSWNAAKRAVEWGLKPVIWYPDGVDGWAEASQPLEPATPEYP